MNRLALAGGAAALVTAALWALHDPVSRPAPAPVAPTPAPSRAPAPGVARTGESAIPEALPPFTLADRDGHPTPVSTWQGRSLIINFWATWCAPCRREMPLLQDIDRERSGDGFRVIGIAVDHRDAVVAFADALQIRYPLLIGEDDALGVAAAVGLPNPVFPFTVFTDRQQRIVALYVGQLHKPEADLILSAVDGTNTGRLTLHEAREAIAAGLSELRAAGSI